MSWFDGLGICYTPERAMLGARIEKMRADVRQYERDLLIHEAHKITTDATALRQSAPQRGGAAARPTSGRSARSSASRSARAAVPAYSRKTWTSHDGWTYRIVENGMTSTPPASYKNKAILPW